MRFIGPALLLDDTLIVSDLHLGLEDRQRTTHALFTRPEKVLETVRELIGRAAARRLVLNGDVLDDFALTHAPARLEIGRVLRTLAKDHELALVRGNHDPMLASLRIPAPIVDSLRIGTALVTHGDRALEEVTSVDEHSGIDTIVIGHEHPAITITDTIRTERFKCFVVIDSVETLFGTVRIIVLPSAHPDLLGTEVDSLRTPIAPGYHPDARIIVAGDPPREFGTLSSFTSE